MKNSNSHMSTHIDIEHFFSINIANLIYLTFRLEQMFLKGNN